MTDKQKHRVETIALHGGHSPDSETKSRAVPIYQTTSFVFDSAKQAADLFSLADAGNIYTRLGNPTTDVLEKRLAELHGGSAAVAFASGQAAITSAILNIAQSCQNIVSTSYLYGGTYTLFHYTLARMGIEVRFVDSTNPANVEAAIDDNTRLVYAESIGNPKNNVDDYPAIADIVHAHSIPFFVDNTVSPPPILNPFDYGADVVLYSLTKYIAGHGTSLGGAIIESGAFDWANGKFPEIGLPDPSYHGLNWWQKFGIDESEDRPSTAFVMKARLQLLRDLGACISPFNSFLILQGLETLPLRVRQHSENALRVAEYLEGHPAVSWVNYPGLESHPDHERALTLLPNGQGGIIGFGIKGGSEAGVKLINSVKLISHLANIGDAKSLIIHPASTTHSQLNPEELEASGVSEDFVRFSVGLENVEDIIADLDQALKSSQK